MFKKRTLSFSLTLIIALMAVGGFILLMNYLAIPPEARPQPTALAATPSVSTSFGSTDPVATVNDTIITEEEWQRATRLDAVMSNLANQPPPTAENTLDRLVNETIVLNAMPAPPPIDETMVTSKLQALQTSWNLSEADLSTALAEENLQPADLRTRLARLLQVEAVLNQLATEQPDLESWLATARAEAEIGLYNALVAAAPVTTVAPTPAPLSTMTTATTITTQAAAMPPSDMPIAPYPDSVAPDFTLPQLNGEPLSLAELRGQPTLINFWATWCPPCRRELPALQTAYEKYGSEIGFVAVDVKEDYDKVANFVEELGLTFPIVLDQNGQVSDQTYAVRGLPTTIFLDRRGVVVQRHIGPLNETDIDNYLTPLLVEETAPMPSADLPAAPLFSLTAADGQTVALTDYRDEQTVVLVFYRGHT